ncbi:MAG TPA: hypothetical protein VGL61_32220 [Kofleriaceae bacterium]
MIVDLLAIGHVVDVAALGNWNHAVAAAQTGSVATLPESRARPRSTGTDHVHAAVHAPVHQLVIDCS